MPAPFRLDSKYALVTGGGSGIGEAVCHVLHEAGAIVLVADLNLSNAERVASQLPGSRAYQCDVSDENSVLETFRTLETLNILVNCAGVGLVGNVQETELEDFRRVMRVNVEGTFLMAKSAVPLLIASGGSMINMGSVAGLIGVKRRFGYCASKGAVVGLTRQLAVDYPTEFRVNCICPGTVGTPFVEGYLEKYHQHEKETVREQLNQRQPIGRLGTAEEIAYLALYLASDQAGFTNGSVIAIDGGWTAA